MFKVIPRQSKAYYVEGRNGKRYLKKKGDPGPPLFGNFFTVVIRTDGDFDVRDMVFSDMLKKHGYEEILEPRLKAIHLAELQPEVDRVLGIIRLTLPNITH